MTSKTRIKIFIKKNEAFLDFMWADVTRDNSVIMGLYGSSFTSSVEKIFDNTGILNPDKDFTSINSDENNANTKITFHVSGRYKFVQKIKKVVTDRVTVKGVPFILITKPTRMLEIILPLAIKESVTTPREAKDQIIDITNFPNKPIRCTVENSVKYLQSTGFKR